MVEVKGRIMDEKAKEIEQILEDIGLDDRQKAVFMENWDRAKEEAKIVAKEEVRKELLEQQERQNEAMARAVERRINEALEEGRKLVKEKVESLEKEKEKVREAVRALKEKREDKIDVLSEKVKFIVETKLRRELGELFKDLHEKKKKLNEAVKKLQGRYRDRERELIEKSAFVVEDVTKRKVARVLKPLVEDIKEARKNEFGRKLFEAMRDEYRAHFMNVNDEFRQLNEENRRMSSELIRTTSKMRKLQEKMERVVNGFRKERAKILSENQKEIRKLREAVKKERLINEITADLVGETKGELVRILRESDVKDFDRIVRRFIVENAYHNRNAKRKRLVGEGVYDEDFETVGDLPETENETDDEIIIDFEE